MESLFVMMHAQGGTEQSRSVSHKAPGGTQLIWGVVIHSSPRSEKLSQDVVSISGGVLFDTPGICRQCSRCQLQQGL